MEGKESREAELQKKAEANISVNFEESQGAPQHQMREEDGETSIDKQSVPVSMNGGNDIPKSGKITYKSVWKYVLLSMITGGIYGIVVLYRYVKDINKICEGDGKESKNYIIVLLLSIITCGIYGIYWWYVQGERLYNIAPKYGVHLKEKGSSILIWEILGCTLMPGIGAFVMTYIMFDNMNRIAAVYNGEISKEEAARLGETHPHLLRNVLITYAVILAAGIGLFILSLGSIFSSGLYDEYEDTDSSLEEITDYSDIMQAEPEDSETITIPVQVINNTGIDIYEFYASESGNSDWEEDILGDDILFAGESMTITFTIYANSLIWDFAIVDMYGDSLPFYSMDFSTCNVDGAVLMLNADGTARLE